MTHAKALSKISHTIRWQAMPELIKFLTPSRAIAAKRTIRSAVCLRPGKLGDMIVATPLFRALKEFGGVERLAVLCSKENEVVIRHNPMIDDVHVVNFHGLYNVLGTVSWIRRQRFDALLDLTPGFSRTNYVMALLAPSQCIRVGVQKGQIGKNYHIHGDGPEKPLAEQYLDVAEKLIGKSIPRPLSYEITADEPNRLIAQQIYRAQKDPCIAINLSAGNQERQWSFEKFRELIRLFGTLDKKYALLLIAVGPQVAWAESLAAENANCKSIGAQPFLAVVEVIGHCRVLVSADTALVHVAASRKVAVVGMYNANRDNTERWKPYAVPERSINGILKDSIDDISPSVVFQEAIALLASIDQ